MKLPNITPAQIKGDVVFVVGVAASLGFKLDGALSDKITAALVGAFAAVKAVNDLVDAVIRRSRAQNADKITPSK